MAGAGARTRKDGSASAKVGSVEVLRARMIGPAVPMRRQGTANGLAKLNAKLDAHLPAIRRATAISGM